MQCDRGGGGSDLDETLSPVVVLVEVLPEGVEDGGGGTGHDDTGNLSDVCYLAISKFHL